MAARGRSGAKRRARYGALLATLVLGNRPDASAAMATTADDPGEFTLQTITTETVVVRARGRDESVFGVPLSVKAYSASDIQEADFRKPGDIALSTPNLSMVESQSVGTSFITLRGLSQVRGGEAPVAFVVDGVIQPDARQFNQQLLDIESIEVLRGPLGALYGRNATGGAILVRTRQPTDATSGRVKVTLGSGHEKAAQVAASGAIVHDKLLFRVAGSGTDREGYIDNLFLRRTADPYRNTTLRGSLQWSPTPELSVDARANRARDDAGGSYFQYQPTRLRADCTADLGSVFDFSRMDANHVERSVCANNLGKNTRDIDDVSLKAAYTAAFGTVAAWVARNHVAEFLAADQFPYSASRNILGGAFDGTQTQYVDTRSTSYELRLTSPTRTGLRWMAGVYGLEVRRFISTTLGSDLGSGIDELTRDPAPATSLNPTRSWLADDNHNNASALFGSVEADITPALELSAAVRHDREQRRQTIDWRQAAASLPAGCGANDVAACKRHARYSAWQPRLSLRYRISPHQVIYASAGRGFRSGRFNQSGVARAAAAATPAVEGVSDEVAAETTGSVELGYKGQWLDGRLRIAAALFRTEVRNAPYFVFIGAVGAQVSVGIDKVSLTGGEAELSASLAPGLEAHAGVGMTRSVIEAYRVNPSAVGHRAPYVPEVSANLTLQQRLVLAPGLQALLRCSVIHKGRQYWNPENSTARSAFTLLNLRAAVEDAQRRWSIGLSVLNATDKVYNAEWASGGFAQPSLPRIVRLDASYEF